MAVGGDSVRGRETVLLVEDEPGFGGWSMKHCGSMGIPCWRLATALKPCSPAPSTRGRFICSSRMS